MLNTMLATAFQNIQCTDHVTADVAVRILQRMAYTRLRTKMHHSLEFLAVAVWRRALRQTRCQRVLFGVNMASQRQTRRKAGTQSLRSSVR